MRTSLAAMPKGSSADLLGAIVVRLYVSSGPGFAAERDVVCARKSLGEEDVMS
jgi:hypothetical protein